MASDLEEQHRTGRNASVCSCEWIIPQTQYAPASVLDVPTQPWRGAHYATYPPALIAPLILATCPRWCCPVCGQGWAAVVERYYTKHRPSGSKEPRANRGNKAAPETNWGTFGTNLRLQSQTLGYQPTCDHPHTQDEARPGIVFDPFVGSGTSAMVAKQLLRRGIGIDLSRPYLDEQAKLRTGAGMPSHALDGLPLLEL
ncbi:MAG: DNA methyltransferase [Anaerolineales bacterium]